MLRAIALALRAPVAKVLRRSAAQQGRGYRRGTLYHKRLRQCASWTIGSLARAPLAYAVSRRYADSSILLRHKPSARDRGLIVIRALPGSIRELHLFSVHFLVGNEA